MNRILLVSFVSASLLALAGCGKSASGTVTDFYKNVEDGKLEAAMEPLPPQAKAMGEEKVKAGLGQQTSQIQAKGGIDKINIVKETQTGDIATIELQITYGDKSTKNETVRLMKSDGKWLMQGGF
jgi:hypothetical protein